MIELEAEGRSGLFIISDNKVNRVQSGGTIDGQNYLDRLEEINLGERNFAGFVNSKRVFNTFDAVKLFLKNNAPSVLPQSVELGEYMIYPDHQLLCIVNY